ncbi:reticulon-2a isoform X1 [Synchiropus splendidus]|uniref:reticulon-2a isoform X1 n=1 Tax=Synchiropus splendidus TaxID=270530 RepID=UPI00237D9D0D|nr:reticulon-2a isoform X1 [Synchiropus splendidus]
MGQVLGFSHCQEYGSVASTPDSTPPCTDGGNEESEMYELQTAREWSDEEEGDEGGAEEDGLASSPSIWGTPRQNSFELTFSYIAIAEPEAVGASRTLRERRRTGSLRSRSPLVHADTLETLLDSPDVDWDPQGFLLREEEEEVSNRREEERQQEDTSDRTELCGHHDPQTVQSTPQNWQTPEEEISLTHTPPPSPSPHQQVPILGSTASEPEPSVTVKLLASSSSAAHIDLNSQEQLVSEHWFSALNLSEDPAGGPHIAVMDLIYWKDMERTGMVLTGLVVGMLSLFQLSIITVLSNISLAVMCFTISVRIYYQFLYILNWGDGEHPFKSYMDMDISLSGEQAQNHMRNIIVMTLSAVETLRKLFLVANLFDSLKFLFLMYLMTYLGALCNGLTLVIVAVIAVFSLPLFYSRRQEQIDGLIAKIQDKIDSVRDTLRRLAHGGGPPPDTTPGGAKPKTQ